MSRRRSSLLPIARLTAALPLLWLAWSSLDPHATAARAQSTLIAGTPGTKGAQVYCYMRSTGNSHEVSWQAAYALIKRQSASMFKTSPEHAAVMITEAVVENPGSFPDCGKYLGSLYEKAANRDKEAAAAAEARGATPPPSRPGNY
ncbi:MAG: hypothetical protein RLZZ459_1247 [Cyanobacteriota bacterium]|jgi:hypothetical protein